MWAYVPACLHALRSLHVLVPALWQRSSAPTFCTLTFPTRSTSASSRPQPRPQQRRCFARTLQAAGTKRMATTRTRARKESAKEASRSLGPRKGRRAATRPKEQGPSGVRALATPLAPPRRLQRRRRPQPLQPLPRRGRSSTPAHCSSSRAPRVARLSRSRWSHGAPAQARLAAWEAGCSSMCSCSVGATPRCAWRCTRCGWS
mmetsp:Transcript_29087/g.93761  ORF Transcript_29087/g.93761 Transcript_29087/m.93761 type:complete len:203 (+) Transcript_29087:381-989(+)